MIFQIIKSTPATITNFEIPFQNGHYDIKLIRIDTFYSNAGSVYSLLVRSEKLYNNSKEFLPNTAPRTAQNISGLFLRAKSNIMENVNAGSGFFNTAFYNIDNVDEYSWKDVYLDGYLDLVIYAGGLQAGEVPYTIPPNLSFCLFTFDITPSKNKFYFAQKEYLKLKSNVI